MSIRLIASDVDGTILPRGGEISARTKAAVHAAIARGIPFVITSGRWYVSAKVIADSLELTSGYMIVAGGGAVVQIDGTPLKEWRLTREQAQLIYDVARTENVMINAFTPDAAYRVNTAALHTPVRGLNGYFGNRYHVSDDDWAAFEREGMDCPYKMETYGDDPAALARIREKLAAYDLNVSSSFYTNLEILAPDAGKGVALRWLAQELGVGPKDCMAFGDNTNDIGLLSAVGWPVAVENAVDDLKAVARLVVDECERDGVAKTIERVLEGKLQ